MDRAEALRALDAERERGLALFALADDAEALEAAQTAVMGRRSRFGELQRALGAMVEDDRREVGKAANAVRAGAPFGGAWRRSAMQPSERSPGSRPDRLSSAGAPATSRIPASPHPGGVRARRHLPAPGIPGRRGPRDRGRLAQLPGAEHPARPSGAHDEGLAVRQRARPPGAAPAHGDQRRPDPHDAVAAAARLRRGARPRLPARDGRRHALARLPPARGPRRRRGHHVRGSQGHAGGGRQGIVRIRPAGPAQPAYFPFVEPGAQVEVSCFICDGAGCRTCGNGWIELLGAGMVHPQVLENCGYDSERYTGFAFGIGIDRVALAPATPSPTSACCSTATSGSCPNGERRREGGSVVAP